MHNSIVFLMYGRKIMAPRASSGVMLGMGLKGVFAYYHRRSARKLEGDREKRTAVTGGERSPRTVSVIGTTLV